MANWKYLTLQDRKNHELYEKRTALGLFFIYLRLSVIFGFLVVGGEIIEYENYYREIHNADFIYIPTTSFFFVSSIPIFYLIFFMILISYFGKDKKTVVSLIILLITIPIIKFITVLVTFKIFFLKDISEVSTFLPIMADKMKLSIVVCIIYLAVFAVYSSFSKPFNIQYLGRVKQ